MSVVNIFGLKKRDSNFELLRIVCMLLIIMYHFAVHGGYIMGNYTIISDFIFSLFYSGGKLGVALFVMITGYYMIKEKKNKNSKLVELELQVLFYSIFLFLIFALFFGYHINFSSCVKFFFPNIFKIYWFFSGYFFLYLCIPYLNKLLLSLSKGEFIKLLIIGLVFFFIIPSIVIYSNKITETVYLFYYYLIGAFIRLYKNEIKGKYRYLFIFLLFYLSISFVTIYLGYLSNYNGYLKDFIYSFSGISSILLFVCCISLFFFFKNINISYNRVINFLSSMSFGVYLFHEHPFVRKLLWQSIFPAYKVLNYNTSLGSVIIIAFFIYLVGCFFDIIRKILFEDAKRLINVKFN